MPGNDGQPASAAGAIDASIDAEHAEHAEPRSSSGTSGVAENVSTGVMSRIADHPARRLAPPPVLSIPDRAILIL